MFAIMRFSRNIFTRNKSWFAVVSSQLLNTRHLCSFLILPYWVFFPDFNFTVQIVHKHLGLWPSMYDMDGASHALLRLWKVYKLNLDDFINGKVQNYTADQPLSDEQVLIVTQYADNNKEDYSEMKWLEALYRRLQKQDGFSRNDSFVIRIARALAASFYKVSK